MAPTFPQRRCPAARARSGPAKQNGLLHTYRRRDHQADRPRPASSLPTHLLGRIGFAHEYRPLRSDELTAVVAQRLPDPNPDDSGLAHTAALAAIVRATNGNFRLADRLVTQVNRILTINKHTHLTPEAVDAAQEALLIGR